MTKTKTVMLLITGLLVFPALSSAQSLKRRVTPRAAMSVKPVEVYTFSTLHVNCIYNVIWKDIPKSYGTVWLQICKDDKSTCGGPFPKSNSGAASFKTDTSMADQRLVIKVYTQDKKYSGYSNSFFVNGMLMQCCPDGRTLPPCD